MGFIVVVFLLQLYYCVEYFSNKLLIENYMCPNSMASNTKKSEDFINDDIVKETEDLIEKQKDRIKKIMGGRK